MALSEKQKRFYEEYLIDCDGQSAAVRAAYSPKTAKSQASRLLNRKKSKEGMAYLDGLRHQQQERTQKTADDVIYELGYVAFSNIADFVDLGKDNIIKLKMPFAQLPRQVTAAIREIGRDKDGHLQIKLHSKVPALESLGKHFGIYEKDNEQRQNMTF